MRDHGEDGVEAPRPRHGEWVIGRRFDTRALAVQWADVERQTFERNETAPAGWGTP